MRASNENGQGIFNNSNTLKKETIIPIDCSEETDLTNSSKENKTIQILFNDSL